MSALARNLIIEAAVSASNGDLSQLLNLIGRLPHETRLYQFEIAFNLINRHASKQIDAHIFKLKSNQDKNRLISYFNSIFIDPKSSASQLWNKLPLDQLDDIACAAIALEGWKLFRNGELEKAASKMFLAIQSAAARKQYAWPNATAGLGVIALAMKDVQTAKIYLNRAVSDGESRGEYGYPHASLNLGMIAAKHDNEEEAIYHYSNAVKSSEARGELGCPEASNRLGFIYANQDFLENAEKHWNRAVDDSEKRGEFGYPIASFNLAKVAALKSNHGLEIAHYKKSLKDAEARGEHGYPDSSFCLAEIALYENDDIRATELLARTVNDAKALGNFGHPRASFNLGIIAERNDKKNLAAKHYSDAVNSAESQGKIGFPLASYNLGGLAKENFDYSSAILHYTRSLDDAVARGEHALPNASLNVGVIAESSGNRTKAFEFYQRALMDAKVRGEFCHPDVNYNLGVISLLEGKNAEAISYFKNSIQDAEARGEHGVPDASGNLGSIAITSMNEHDAAINWKRAIIDGNKISDNGHPLSSYCLGVLMIQPTSTYYNLSQALYHLREASRDNGGVYLEAHLTLAHLRRQENPEEARRLAFEALAYAPYSTLAVSVVKEHFAKMRNVLKYDERIKLLLRYLDGEQLGESLKVIEKKEAGLIRIESLLSKLEDQRNTNSGRIIRLLALLKEKSLQISRLNYLIPYATRDYASAYLMLESEFEGNHELTLRDHFVYLDVTQNVAEPRNVLEINLSAAKEKARGSEAFKVWSELEIEQVHPEDPYLFRISGLSWDSLVPNQNDDKPLKFRIEINSTLDSVRNRLDDLEALVWICLQQDLSIENYLDIDIDLVDKLVLESIQEELSKSNKGNNKLTSVESELLDALKGALSTSLDLNETKEKRLEKIAGYLRKTIRSRNTFRQSIKRITLGDHSAISDKDHTVLLWYSIYLLHVNAHLVENPKELLEGALGEGIDFFEPDDAFVAALSFLPIIGLSILAKALIGIATKKIANLIWDSVRNARIMSLEEFQKKGFPILGADAGHLRKLVRLSST